MANHSRGDFCGTYTHLGCNQDTHGRQVHDGLWIQGAGARMSLNVRFAMPSGHLTYYLPGAEGPQWWHKWPDRTRDLPTASLLDRCRKTHTCPKIIETFSSGEMWSLQTSPTLVGTDARADIPEPTNVRRYYMPCGGHHGGFVDGSFSLEASPPPPSGPRNPTSGLLPATSLSYLETYNAIRHHVRNWVTKNIPPPPSRVPKLHGENACLVAPTKEAMGFPDLPGLPEDAPTGLMHEVLDYDFGPEFDYMTGSGIITKVPPKVKRIIPSLVPRVDKDGNEVATSGVPIVQHLTPLGTYLGWNIVADGFAAGRLCDMRDGMIPFAKTKAERLANGDPRLSLEERYGDHAGRVAAVKRAAAHAVKQGFLLPDDAESLIQRARQANEGWPTQPTSNN